tara:strand:+ start:519 stop:785 length:267 start_codon:yes stop_codon:yes gene_type:complete
MKVPGTVTINLDDYLELVEHSQKTTQLRENTSRAAKELSVFLSFLCTREDIDRYIEEFNRQSTTSEIVVEDGRATIQFKDDKNEIHDE